MLKAEPLNKKEDVAGAKMLKAFHFIEQNLIFHGFKVIESDMLWHSKGTSLFYYALESDNLPKTKEVAGPPVKIRFHAELFKKKYKSVFVKNNKTKNKGQEGSIQTCSLSLLYIDVQK